MANIPQPPSLFSCPICGSEFSSDAEWRLHYAQHNLPWPPYCNTCHSVNWLNWTGNPNDMLICRVCIHHSARAVTVPVVPTTAQPVVTTAVRPSTVYVIDTTGKKNPLTLPTIQPTITTVNPGAVPKYRPIAPAGGVATPPIKTRVDEFVCDICFSYFFTKRSLNSHLVRYHHLTRPSKRWGCCGHVFSNEFQWKHHYNMNHQMPYPAKCPECNGRNWNSISKDQVICPHCNYEIKPPVPKTVAPPIPVAPPITVASGQTVALTLAPKPPPTPAGPPGVAPGIPQPGQQTYQLLRGLPNPPAGPQARTPAGPPAAPPAMPQLVPPAGLPVGPPAGPPAAPLAGPPAAPPVGPSPLFGAPAGPPAGPQPFDCPTPWCTFASYDLADFWDHDCQGYIDLLQQAAQNEPLNQQPKPDLDQAQEQEVTAALRPGRGYDIFDNPTAFNDTINRTDLWKLRPGKLLNEQIINYYMQLIQLKGTDLQFPSVHAFASLFYRNVKKGYGYTKTWMRNINVFHYDYVIVPVHHEQDKHWCLAIVDNKMQRLCYYDPNGGATFDFAKLRETLTREAATKNVAFDANAWTNEIVQNIPRHQNDSDSGVFICAYADYVTREVQMDFTQQDMPRFRRRMVYEIMKNQLL